MLTPEESEAVERTVIRLAIASIKAIRDETEDEAQRLLAGAWTDHFRAVYADTPNETLSSMVAVIVLDRYFRTRGNWSVMLQQLEEKLRRS